MNMEKKYFKELRKKVDIYFVIIISILSLLAIFMVTELNDKIKGNLNFIIIIVSICLFLYLFSIRDNNESKNITEFDKIIAFSTIFSIISIIFLLIARIINFYNNASVIHTVSKIISVNNPIKENIFYNLMQSILYNPSIGLLLLFFTSIILLIRRYLSYKKVNKTKNTDAKDYIESKSYTLDELFCDKPNSDKLKELRGYFNKNNEENYEEIDIGLLKTQLLNTPKIIIKDNDIIDKDIFERKIIKNEISNTIEASFKYNCFSIGIVGKWGSGKSSIIRLTLDNIPERNKYIIIDDFDSWIIKSQDSLILAMYNTIMENLGENISYFKRKKVQNALINITANIPYIGKGIGSFFENRIDDYSEYKEIKADLEKKLKKLKKSDKRLIFIIDNLDRMNSENVVFLLTLIETLFKLPNITYILAYDKNRLNRIFKKSLIDSEYLEKIINKEIFIPFIERSIFKTCLKNMANYYDYELNSKIIFEICKYFKNIRQYIIFCNSFSEHPNGIKYIEKKYLTDFLEDKYKNLLQDKQSEKDKVILGLKYDLTKKTIHITTKFFIIQSIKFFDYELYLDIYKNKDILLDKSNPPNSRIHYFLKNKNKRYSKYKKLLELLISKTNNEEALLSPIIFEICFFELHNQINRIEEFIKDIYGYYNSIENAKANLKNFLDTEFETDLNLDRFEYAFCMFQFIINFSIDISYEQKEMLWNLFSQCTSHSKKSLYSFIEISNYNDKIESSLDDNIKNILKCIFDNLDDKERNILLNNQLNSINESKEEYCKKLFIYDWVFENENNKNFKEFIRKLYQPVFDEPMFLWEKYKSDKFYSNLKNHLNLDKTKILDYVARLYKKIEKDGQHLYEYIEFIDTKQIDDVKDNKTVLTIENIFKLIEKYPPKNKEEKEIYDRFKLHEVL